MRPTFGAVTATLNARGTVLAAVRSVMEQCEAPAEYTVIDGGSADGTPELVEAEFEALRARGCTATLRLLRQSRGPGIAHAWNEAIDGLASEVVALVNADDWLEPGAARAAIDAFAADPRADIVHGNARFHAADGREMGVLAPTWVNRLGIQCRTLHPATFVRRRVYAEVGAFDPRYRTTLDYDFLERCWRRGRRFRHLDRVLANFRLGGLSNTHRAQADAETLRIGLAHSRTKVLPLAAWAVRKALMRPAGLAGFELWLRDRPAPAMAAREVEIKPAPARPRERVDA